MSEAYDIKAAETLGSPRPARGPAQLIGPATRAGVLALGLAKDAGLKDAALTTALLASAEKLSSLAARQIAKPAPQAEPGHARVTSPAELIKALADHSITEVELPFHILDQRWRSEDVREALAKRDDVTVHVFGAFMNGLLSRGLEARWPKIAGVDPAFIVETLDMLARAFHRQSRADLCLAYVRAQNWIDGVLVHPGDADEWETYTRLSVKAPLTPAECATVEDMLPQLPTALLDPSLWP